MAQHKRKEAIFQKFVEGKYTLQELHELLASFQKEDDRDDLLSLIEQHLLTNSSGESQIDATIVTEKVLEKIKQQNRFGNTSTPMISLWPNRLKKLAVVAVFILSFVGIYLYQLQQPNHPLQTAQHHDIDPGTNKAILTLSDGREVSLDDIHTGELTTESGVSIHKSVDGQLIYTIQNTATGTDTHRTNTIRTPRGGQYQVVLPDGTKVWLNSASSLTYPVNFAVNSRRVSMTGEIYFEVASSRDASGNRIPFVVECPDQTIEVLGTQFNVNAYRDERNTSTTLLEGSVRLIASYSRAEILLKPGEQAQLQEERFRVAQVNVESAVDWKTGDFVFTDQSLQSIMRKIARWYDVDIQYQQHMLPEEGFIGRVSRNKKLSEVLNVLEISAGVDLKIVDRVIIVDGKQP